MENSGGISASLAGRYATALFGLAREQNSIDTVESSLNGLQKALAESAEFSALTTSPVIARTAARAAIDAVAKSMGLDTLSANMLGVLADNRRLDQLGAIIAAFKAIAAKHRGEVSAQVTSAFPLSDGQLDALKAQLKSRVGSDVAVTTHVDPSLLGGLVVKIGSQMIDSSIKTRLNSLAHAMKG